MQNQSKEALKLIYNALEDKKAMDIKIIRIEEISSLGDYFVIASGSNNNQVQAMSDNVEEKLKEAGYSPKQVEGYQGASWILLDYADIIIHLFDEESRSFYDLEHIWRDGAMVSIEELLS